MIVPVLGEGCQGQGPVVEKRIPAKQAHHKSSMLISHSQPRKGSPSHSMLGGEQNVRQLVCRIWSSFILVFCSFFRGFTKGWFPKGWFGRCSPTEISEESYDFEKKSWTPKTGMRAHSPKPPFCFLSSLFRLGKTHMFQRAQPGGKPRKIAKGIRKVLRNPELLCFSIPAFYLSLM